MKGDSLSMPCRSPDIVSNHFFAVSGAVKNDRQPISPCQSNVYIRLTSHILRTRAWPVALGFDIALLKINQINDAYKFIGNRCKVDLQLCSLFC